MRYHQYSLGITINVWLGIPVKYMFLEMLNIILLFKVFDMEPKTIISRFRLLQSEITKIGNQMFSRFRFCFRFVAMEMCKGENAKCMAAPAYNNFMTRMLHFLLKKYVKNTST